MSALHVARVSTVNVTENWANVVPACSCGWVGRSLAFERGIAAEARKATKVAARAAAEAHLNEAS